MKLFIFLFTLSILHQISASSPSKSSSDPIKETVIPLYRDKDTYTVQVTIANKAEDSSTAIKANALVSLSSNFVAFADDQNNNKCFDFKGINTAKLPVTRSASTADITANYFNKVLTGKAVNSVTTMEGNLWKTSFEENSIGAVTCGPSRLTSPETYGKIGYIGLAADDDSGVKHFSDGINSFGVYIPQEAWKDGKAQNQDGKLIFNPYLTAKKPTKLYQRLPVYSNWTIPNLVSISVNTEGPALNKYSVTFDINTPYIGLPEEIHEAVMSQLATSGLKCEVKDHGLPDCDFTGDATQLPMITIKVNNPTHKDSAIVITPDMYVSELANGADPKTLKGKVHLNLQSLQTEDSKLEDYENPAFTGFIILGQAFMKQRYVVFEITTSQVLIYEKLPSDYKPITHKENSGEPAGKNSPGEDSDFGKYFKYVLLAFGIVVVLILIWCLWNRRTKSYDSSMLDDPNSSYVSIVRG